MKTLACVCILLFAVMTLSAADISGKWSGSFTMTNAEGETHEGNAFVIFKQNGTEITGSGGPDENQQWPISKGKIEGDKITFEVQSDGPLYKVSLTLDGDHIKGEATVVEEGQPANKAKVDLTRVK
jgi:hypothetical protein